MPEIITNYLPLLAVAAALVLVMWWGRRRTKGTGGSGGRGESLDEEVDQRQRLRRAIEKLEINLMEFSRDVEGRLDTRIRTLNKLIEDADERIARLEELEKNRPPGLSGPGTERRIPQLHREIYDLADSGLDKVEIARRTSIPTGEVELILGLRRSEEQ